MEIATAFAHLFEFFIVFIFYNSVYYPKKKPAVAALIGIAMYSAVLVVFFLFDSTVVNIIAGAIFNFCFAKLLFFCKIKDALFSSLFLSVALTASEFAVISGVSSLNGGNINFYQSSLHMLIILVIISRLVFLVIALSVSFFVQKNSLKRLPLFLFFFPVSLPVLPCKH